MRTIRSVNGHEITIFDPPATGGDSGYVRIRDALGNSVELANGRITISGVGVIQINAQHDDERPRGRSGRTAYLVDSTRNNYLAHLSVLAILFA
jgi:hypothetical protein